MTLAKLRGLVYAVIIAVGAFSKFCNCIILSVQRSFEQFVRCVVAILFGYSKIPIFNTSVFDTYYTIRSSKNVREFTSRI